MQGIQSHWRRHSVVDDFCLPVSHSLSQVIYRAICAVRDSLSIPLCSTLCWAHTAFTDTHTLMGLSSINVYDKLRMDCEKNMDLRVSFFPDFFQHYRRLLHFFLYGSSLIHISAGHSLNCLTSGFWIARKSLTHGNIFSSTSQNPVGPRLPLPHVVLKSGPIILHRMLLAFKESAVIFFILIFNTGTPWLFFQVARWPHVLIYPPIPCHLLNLIYPYSSSSCVIQG